MQLDPLTWAYPELTPYQYASNDPITNIDIDGLDGAASNVAKAVEKAVWTNAKVLEEVSVMGLKHAAPTALSVTGNFFKGIGSSIWGSLKGLYNIVRHPINTIKGVGNAALHPWRTAKALYQVGKTLVNDLRMGMRIRKPS